MFEEVERLTGRTEAIRYAVMTRLLQGDRRWDAFRERVGMSQERLAAIEFDVELP